MTSIADMPVSKVIDYKNSVLVEPFIFESDILKALYLQSNCVIPSGFTMDWESVPLIKGTSKISGLVHDYLCRIDSEPVVTKKVAADVYKEFLVFRKTSWWRVQIKYWAVRMSPGYFHKKKVGWSPEF